MVMSVNTNSSAMAALQTLNATNRDLEKLQTRINTGLKIAGPKDDGAIFAIAQKMRGEVAGFEAVKSSLNNSVSIVDVAIAAGTAISDLLIDMKAKSVAALDLSLDTVSRNALEADFQALKDQIVNITKNAEFNGASLIGASALDLIVLANPDGSTITVTAQFMTVTALSLVSASLSTGTSSSLALNSVNLALTDVNQKLGRLGTRGKSLEVHGIFVGKLIDSLTTGIGNLVDADLAADSARLQALQIKQQLGLQTLSIANTAPQNILQLFQ